MIDKAYANFLACANVIFLEKTKNKKGIAGNIQISIVSTINKKGLFVIIYVSFRNIDNGNNIKVPIIKAVTIDISTNM